MKTALLSILMTTLFAGIVFGAAAGDRPMSQATQTIEAPEREVPAPLWQRLEGMTDILELAAKDAYWNRNYTQAAQIYHLMLKAGTCHSDDLYNLACCYGQMGKVKPAAKYLQLSVDTGFDDVEHIKDDPDFKKVKNSPIFQMTLDRIGKEVSKKTQKNDKAAEPALTDGYSATGESASGSSVTVSYGSMN